MQDGGQRMKRGNGKLALLSGAQEAQEARGVEGEGQGGD